MNQTSGGSKRQKVEVVGISIIPEKEKGLGLQVIGAGKYTKEDIPQELNGMEIPTNEAILQENKILLNIKGKMIKMQNGAYVNVKAMQKARKAPKLDLTKTPKVKKTRETEMEI